MKLLSILMMVLGSIYLAYFVQVISQLSAPGTKTVFLLSVYYLHIFAAVVFGLGAVLLWWTAVTTWFLQKR